MNYVLSASNRLRTLTACCDGPTAGSTLKLVGTAASGSPISKNVSPAPIALLVKNLQASL